MGVSAAWAVVAGLLFFGGPFLAAALGLDWPARTVRLGLTGSD